MSRVIRCYSLSRNSDVWPRVEWRWLNIITTAKISQVFTWDLVRFHGSPRKFSNCYSLWHDSSLQPIAYGLSYSSAWYNNELCVTHWNMFESCHTWERAHMTCVLPCVAECCRVLQCVCCRVLPRVLHCVAVCCSGARDLCRKSWSTTIPSAIHWVRFSDILNERKASLII